VREYVGRDHEDLRPNPRGCLPGLAVIAAIILTIAFVELNPVERLQLQYFPAGRPVPVTELVPFAPARLVRANGAATSIHALRHAVLAPACFDGSETSRDCWSNIRVPPSTLVLATVGTYCPSHEWFAWVNGRMLTVMLTTWGCAQLGRAGDAGAEASDVVLGVPLDRLPGGQLKVRFADTGSPPVPVTG